MRPLLEHSFVEVPWTRDAAMEPLEEEMAVR